MGLSNPQEAWEHLWPDAGSLPSTEVGGGGGWNTAVCPHPALHRDLGRCQGESAEVTGSPGNAGREGRANSRSIQPETSS